MDKSLNWLIPPEQVAVDPDSPLGGLASSSVKKGKWNDSVVAVKVLAKSTPIDDLRKRTQLWESLRHPHIVQIFGVSFFESGNPLILLQFYSNGNITQFLTDHPTHERGKLILEIALGMQFIHGRGLVHGSLKPTNVLISDSLQACIADTGMIEVQKSNHPGSHRYLSPEGWKGTISRPSDVYAFAMTALEIVTLAPSWGVLSQDQIYNLVVRENERPDRPEEEESTLGLTDSLWEIIQSAWVKEPRNRPNFSDLVGRLKVAGDNTYPRSIKDADTLSIKSGPPAYNGSMTPTRGMLLPDAGSRLNVQSIALAQRVPHNPSFHSQSNSFSSRSSEFSDIDDSNPSTSPSTEGPVTPNPQGLNTHPFGIHDSLYPTTKTESDPTATANNNGFLTHRPQSSQASGASAEWGVITPSNLFNPLPPMRFSQTTFTPSEADGNFRFSSDSSLRGEPFVETQWSPPLDPIKPVITSINNHERENSDGVGLNAVLLAGALQVEATEGRKPQIIDAHLYRVQQLALKSDKDAHRLVTAGIIPTLILILKARAVDGVGLEIILVTLGVLAVDSISANTIYRTQTAMTFIEILNSSVREEVSALSIWCINRICRSNEIALGLVKQGLASVLIRRTIVGNQLKSRFSAWCLGNLIRTDALAEILVLQDIVRAAAAHLQRCAESLDVSPCDVCAAIFLVARIARSIKLSKALTAAGCVKLVAHFLNTSDHPQILMWSARAVGCLMRPNSSDMAKALLDADCAKGLARLPSVLAPHEVEPLGSFAFAIQRFSCAEWGAGTRKALVEAGVVDSLLAALRTAVDTPFPKIHIELALAVSHLGDVGGSPIRKEIIRAGGVHILRRASAGNPEVEKACSMAITTITGNIWTRNAASAKTAMAHNWNGGCPDHQPPCPVTISLTD